MARMLIAVAIVAVLMAVFAVVDCAFADVRWIRGLPRWAWILLILVLPVLGPLLWLLVGRGHQGRPVGPDDDPRFIGRRAGSGGSFRR